MTSQPRAALVAAGAAAAAPLVAAALASRRAPLLTRTNFRGRPVTLAAGPAFAVVTTVGALLGPGRSRQRAALALAAGASGALGLYDDVVGSASARGLHGHLGALLEGRLTSGAVKVAGLALTGVGAARLAGHAGRDALLSGAVVAGAANLANLLDVRPGRALKVGLAVGSLLQARGRPELAAPLGAGVGVLRSDLAERTMLGDAGSNALGAALGIALVAAPGRGGRGAALALITALTLASEVVSFSDVIEATSPLRWVDRLGRRP